MMQIVIEIQIEKIIILTLDQLIIYYHEIIEIILVIYKHIGEQVLMVIVQIVSEYKIVMLISVKKIQLLTLMTHIFE